MMISDPNLIYYACIAKGTIILAEFNSKDADLGALALKCLEKTPPLHSVFSHTVRARTYTFLIDNPIAYFAIFDENLENSEGLAFLRGVKDAFHKVGEGSSTGRRRLEHLTSHCFQGEFNPVFHQLLAANVEMYGLSSPSPGLKSGNGRNGSANYSRGTGNGPARMPLLGDAYLKKKKRFLLGECVGAPGGIGGKDGISEKGLDASDSGAIGLSREFSVTMHKNGLYSGDLGHQKAKKVWKKHVWVVLSMDLTICTILFVVWLWICRGFKCIDA